MSRDFEEMAALGLASVMAGLAELSHQLRKSGALGSGGFEDVRESMERACDIGDAPDHLRLRLRRMIDAVMTVAD